MYEEAQVSFSHSHNPTGRQYDTTEEKSSVRPKVTPLRTSAYGRGPPGLIPAGVRVAPEKVLRIPADRAMKGHGCDFIQ